MKNHEREADAEFSSSPFSGDAARSAGDALACFDGSRSLRTARAFGPGAARKRGQATRPITEVLAFDCRGSSMAVGLA